MRDKAYVPWRVASYGLVLVGFFLRVYQLDGSAVTRDQAVTIQWFIRPGIDVLLTRDTDLNNHPLVSLLAWLFAAPNESVFAMKWPIALIGVLAIPALIRIARHVFDERTSIVSGLLISMSGYHVLLSQRLRGYVGLQCFTVLCALFAYRAGQTGRRRYWLGFVISAALLCWTHLYGVLAVGMMGLAGLCMLVFRLGAGLTAVRNSARALILSVAAAYAIATALYSPMATEVTKLLLQQNKFTGAIGDTSEPTIGGGVSRAFLEAVRPFSLVEETMHVPLADSPSVRYGPFDDAARLAQGNVGLFLALGSVVLGIVFSWRRYRAYVIICLQGLFLPFILQWVIYFVLPGAYIQGRFLAFIYSPYLLLMTRGWVGLGEWMGARSGRWPWAHRIGRAAEVPGISALLVLNLTWLSSYYLSTSETNWPAVARIINDEAGEDDLVMCGQLPQTSCHHDIGVRTGRDVQRMREVITLDNLRTYPGGIERPGQVWIVMPHMTAWQVSQMGHLMTGDQYRLVPGTESGRSGIIVAGDRPTIAGNAEQALGILSELCLDAQECYRSNMSLTHLYLANGDLESAQESLSRAMDLGVGLEESHQSIQEHDMLADELRYRWALRALPGTAQRVRWDSGDGVRLVGYDLQPSEVLAGDELRVTSYWQPTAPRVQTHRWTLRLTDLNSQLLAETNGRLEMNTGQRDQVRTEVQDVRLDADTDAPCVARVSVVMQPPGRDGVSLPAVGSGEQPGVSLAEVRVLPRVWPTVAPAHPMERDFGGAITLLGYDWVPDQGAVVLYWRPQVPIHLDLTVFVHVIGADGTLVDQMDGLPRQANYPTSWWSPGQVIVDRHTGRPLPAGSYTLKVGWYRLEDGSRLALADGSGDSVTLEPIRVP